MTALPAPARRELPAGFAALSAADVMQRDLVSVQANDPVYEVARVLADSRVSGVPVLDAEQRLLGVISQADIVRRTAEVHDLPGEDGFPRFGDDVDETEVVAFDRGIDREACAGDLMSVEVCTVAPTTGLREVAQVFCTQRIHRVLVLERGKLVGLVSTLDVLRAIASP